MRKRRREKWGRNSHHHNEASVGLFKQEAVKLCVSSLQSHSWEALSSIMVSISTESLYLAYGMSAFNLSLVYFRPLACGVLLMTGLYNLNNLCFPGVQFLCLCKEPGNISTHYAKTCDKEKYNYNQTGSI